MRKKCTLKKLLLTSVISGLSFLSFGQILLNEGFEGASFPPTGWTTIDNDGTVEDNWVMLDNTNTMSPAIQAFAGTQFATSYSWLNNTYTPDNWLVTPQITIPDNTYSLSFKGMSNWGQPTGGVAGDHLGVFVSTTGTAPADFTSIFEQDFSTETWESVQLSLAAYAGQSIYIAFRHYNCTDMFVMGLDNIVVAAPFVDISVNNLRYLTEYTAIPSMYAPYNIKASADITNLGTASAGAFQVVTNIYLNPDLTNPVATFTNDFASLNSGATVTVDESYTVATNGLYAVTHEVNYATDADPNNNFNYNYDTINFTTNQYARDNINSGLYTIGLGTIDGVIGSVFDVVTPSVLDSVLYIVAPTTAGGTVQVKVSAVDVNGIPTTTYIGQSATVDLTQQIVDAGYGILVGQMTASGGGALNLAPGKYFIGIEEAGGADMLLYHSDSIYTPNTSFGSLSGAAFDSYENLGVTGRTPVLHNFLHAQFTAPVITSNDTDNTVCQGQSITLSSSEATGNQWYLNGTMIPGETNQTLNVTTSGSYTVEVATLLSNVIDVVVNSLPTVDAGSDVQICSGSSYTQNASGASTYVWDNGVANGASSTLPDGINTLNVVGTDVNGCSNSDAVTVTVLALPTISQGTVTNPSICQALDGSIVVNGSSTGTLSWTGTASGSLNGSLPLTINGIGAGSYNISFTDGNTCGSNSLNVSLTDPGVSTPVITANGPTTFCEGGNVSITSDVANGITWSTGETSQTITVSSSANISVTFVNGSCSATSNVISVIVNPNPIISLNTSSNPTTCSGSNGSVSINTSANGTFNWSGTSSGSMTSNGSPTTINGFSAGTYTFSLISASTCTSNSFDVTFTDPVATIPTITANGPTTFCEGGSVTLTSSNADLYAWNNAQASTTQTITVTTAGTYVVSTVLNGCSATSQSITVAVNPNPIVNAGQDLVICIGDNVTLQGVGALNYLWDNGVVNGQPFQPTATATYTVIGADANMCTGTDQVTIVVNYGSISGGADQTICAGLPVTLSGSNGINFTWNNGVTNGVAFTPTQTQTYTVTGTGTNGCPGTDDVIVTVNPIPNVNAGNDITVCIGAQATLVATGASTYTWTGGILNATPFTVTDTVTYTVMGTLNGCSNTDDVTVFAEDCSGINEAGINNLVMYPNPTSSTLTIKADDLSSVSSIEVRDQIGRIVVSYNTISSNVVLLELGNLANGTYFVTLNGNGVSTTPIQINK